MRIVPALQSSLFLPPTHNKSNVGKGAIHTGYLPEVVLSVFVL